MNMNPVAIFIFLVFLIQAGLFAAPQIEATVNRNTLSIRDTLTFRITVISDDKNGGELSAPQFPADFPFQVLRQIGPSRSTQSNVSFINGHMESNSTVTCIYQFLLKPTTIGTLRIPALELAYGKSILKTTPIQIKVTDAKQKAPTNAAQSSAPQTEFRQYLSPKETVMGAPVQLTYELLVPAPIDLKKIGPEYRKETISQDFKAEGYDDPQWTQKSTIIDGVRYTIVYKTVRLTPKHPGKFEIPGCVMTYEYRSPKQDNSQNRRRRSFFDDDFFDDDFFDDDFPFFGRGGQMEQDTVVAEPLTLTVEDFPLEGRPQEFSGLIGPIDVTAGVDLQEVYVGDPIVLTIRLTGESLDSDSKLPDLKSVLEKDGKFRVSGDDPITIDEDGNLTFSRTLRVLSEDVTEIPALEIPYYDLKKKTYETTRTKALPITVQKAQQVTLEDAHVQGQTTYPTVNPDKGGTVLAETEGVVENIDQDALRQPTWSPFPGDPQRRGLLLILCLGALAIWGILTTILFLRRRNARISPAERAARNAKGALMTALANIDETDTQAGRLLAEAFQTFLRQRFRIAGALTVSDLQNTMQCKDYSPELIQNAQELLTQCDAMQYGGATLSVEELRARILTVTENL